MIDCGPDGGGAPVVGPYRDAGVTPPYAAAPARVDVTADLLAAGSDTTCVKTAAKTVECWGADQMMFNPVADGILRSSNAVPRRIGCLPEVKALAVGTLASCGVLLDGSLRCWGTLALQQLGAYFGEDCPFGDYCRPTAFPLTDGLVFDSLVQRGGAFLARAPDGAIVSWGLTDLFYVDKSGPPDLGAASVSLPLALTGRLGTAKAALVRDVLELPKVTSVSLGERHACAVSDGRVMCWGLNTDGVVGRNSSAGARVYPTPVEALLPADARATSVSVNDRNTCARVSDGRVFCWGDNASGQLGTKKAVAESALPLEVEGLPGLAVEVAMMAQAACALLKDGSVACWGSHAAGQLGDPGVAITAAPHPAPVKVRF